MDVAPVISLFSILGALAVGMVSPGPAFLFVTRTAVASPRREGLACAAGMGLGAAIICTLALLGVRVMIERAQWLYLGFKMVGGCYLLYLSWRLWRGASLTATEPGTVQQRASGALRSFLLALATQLSNPKALIVIGGVIAALLPAHAPAWMYGVIPPVNLLMETAWYSFVALVMSSPAPRRVYLRAKTGIDCAAGGVLAFLGLRLVIEGAQRA